MLTERRAEAVELLRDSLVAPRFDEDALERVRGQVLSGLRSDRTDPRSIAGRAMRQLIYGDHPYARPGDGTIESVTALDRADILDAAHRAALARDRVHVSAVGDITAEELGALLDRLLGDLPETGAALPEARSRPARRHQGRGIRDAAIGGAVRATRPRPARSRFPDRLCAQPHPRRRRVRKPLMTEVREKRGLTYGVYSYLADKDAADLWMGSVSPRPMRAWARPSR